MHAADGATGQQTQSILHGVSRAHDENKLSPTEIDPWRHGGGFEPGQRRDEM